VFKHLVVGLAVVGAASTSGTAQAPRASAPARETEQARYNLFTMEGVLERAVEQGADRLRRQVRRIMPDMLLMSGAAEARGFRLEGYGVFFDVEVPVLRRSVAWTLRSMIEENGLAATAALQRFKSHIETIPDARLKAELQQALRRIELQVGPVPSLPGAPERAGAAPRPPRNGVAAASVDSVPGPTGSPQALTAIDEALITNPSEVYEREVVSALIDAMLDYSGPLGVGPDEWLTVAARDNEHRDRLMPGDAYDLMTIVLRIKGSDLAAFRGERISKEEARKRVEIREF